MSALPSACLGAATFERVIPTRSPILSILAHQGQFGWNNRRLLHDRCERHADHQVAAGWQLSRD
jgi:hypothetical protein